MRTALAIVVLLLPALARADDNDLLQRFKQQNEQSRELLKASIKAALEKAEKLEKAEPAQALRLLQEVRDRMLAQGQLSGREDRELAEPLWERIRTLRGVLRGQTAAELRASVNEYKEYLSRQNEQFALLRKSMIPPSQETPPGGPAFIAYQNGKTAIGWLNEPPVYSVNCTINDQPVMLGPGSVSGLQTADAYYLHDPATKRFIRIAPAEFFVTAIASYPPARASGFWVPGTELPPPVGFDRRSAGAMGVVLFGRCAAVLMTMWTNPSTRPANLGADRLSSPELARLHRDVLIELKVQETFAKLRKEDRERFRDIILGFLDRRPGQEPLSDAEIVRFADLLAEIHPEWRSEGVAFAHVLNRILEPQRSSRK